MQKVPSKNIDNIQSLLTNPSISSVTLPQLIQGKVNSKLFNAFEKNYFSKASELTNLANKRLAQAAKKKRKQENQSNLIKKILDDHKSLYEDIGRIQQQKTQTLDQIDRLKYNNEILIKKYQNILNYFRLLPPDEISNDAREIQILCYNALRSIRPENNYSESEQYYMSQELGSLPFNTQRKKSISIQTDQLDLPHTSFEKHLVKDKSNALSNLQKQNEQLRLLLEKSEKSNISKMNSLKDILSKCSSIKTVI